MEKGANKDTRPLTPQPPDLIGIELRKKNKEKQVREVPREEAHSMACKGTIARFCDWLTLGAMAGDALC